MNSGHVYLMKTRDHNYYKVGYTADDVIPRLNNIRIACPFKLDAVAAYLVRNPRDVEKYLHGKLKEWRMSGEWFDLPEDVVDEVACRLCEISTECACSKFCRNEYAPRIIGAPYGYSEKLFKEIRGRYMLQRVQVEIDERMASSWKALTNKTEWLHQKLNEKASDD